MLGYTREELRTMDVDALHAGEPPYTIDRVKSDIRRAGTDGPQTVEWRCQTKAGDQLPVEVHLRQATIDDQDRILATVRDITGREECECELRETNRQLQAMLDTVEGAIFIKDTAGRYQLLNKKGKELLGLDPDTEVVGLTDDDLFSEAVAEQYRTDDQRVLERGETIEIEEEVPTPEGVQTNLTLKSPLFDTDGEPAGVCALSTDITDRTERERELQARSAAMEASIDGMAVLDSDEEYIFVNQAHADTYGYDDPDAFLGETWRMCYEGDDLAQFEDEIMPTLEADGAWRGVATGQRKDGTTFPQELSLTTTDDGGIICVVRDITGRKESEADLRRQRRLVQGILNAIPDVVFAYDEAGNHIVEEALLEEFAGYPKAETAEMDLFDFLPEADRADAREHVERVFEGGETVTFESEIVTRDGRYLPHEYRAAPMELDGNVFGVAASARDVTDRLERERRLREARQFNEELVENAPFGMFRLDEDLRVTYENPRAEEIIGVPGDESRSAAIGEDIRELPSIVETGEADLFTRLQDGETIEFEFPFESIYGQRAYFTGRGVPIYRDGAFDGALLMVIDISERRRHERELERQREQLAALNDLNDIVRGITEAVINQSSREEIEHVVCDKLAASESYRFAWISAVDSNRQLDPRTEAGVDGYLDEIPLSTDPDDPAGRGPAGEAVRTREIQITQNVTDDPTFGPWHEYARKYGYRSAAAIPIVNQAVLYGVLGVYSERPDAFSEEERKVFEQLGEVVGYAIAALNRKQALMSDEVVELNIRVPRLLTSWDVSATTDDVITVDRTVPLGDDEYLMYGTATADAMTVIHALSERRPDWKAVRTIDETDGEVRFEQRLSNPPMTSTVADHGGYVAGGRIEDGEYRATFHLPPGTDLRRVVAEIRGTYPDVETLSQQQVTREEPTPRQLLSLLAEKLTERQRAALEAGYYGGFFEWPRDRSGEDVAESLDIGASTFHQHVRKAEKKLLDVVFTET